MVQVNRKLLELAFDYPFLMHASLAVAFTYDRHLNSSMTCRRTLEECYHWSQSTLLLNRRLKEPIEAKDKDPIWGTAAALAILAFSSTEACTPEESWPLKSTGPSDLDWLHMSEGKMVLWHIVNPLRPDSLFRVMAATYAQMHSPLPKGGIDGIPMGLTTLCRLEASSTPDNNPYFHAAHAVSQILELPESEVTTGLTQLFMRSIHGPFKDLLHKRDPIALLLLYLWYQKAGWELLHIPLKFRYNLFAPKLGELSREAANQHWEDELPAFADARRRREIFGKSSNDCWGWQGSTEIRRESRETKVQQIGRQLVFLSASPMPRKGIQKVKTGCTTCKIRKVKCDESWPQCMRCKSTGRTCDGYRSPPTGSLSWDVLLRAQPSVSPAADNTELRSLAFFRQAVAPVLSGPFDASFWTHLVTQVMHHEPAVCHAVLAISSLYENFSPESLQPQHNAFAIRHYNKAIQLLLGDKAQTVDTVLVVCALFICIEFLRGDHEAAISHSRHGVHVLNTAQKPSRLAVVFCHMSIFPFFFGETISDFPLIANDVPKAAANFPSMIEAQYALDLLAVRSVRLVRDSDKYRLGVAAEEAPPPSLLDEQRQVGVDLDKWEKAFSRFSASRALNTHQDTASLALKMRCLVCRVWAENCLSHTETSYDKHKSTFEDIVNMGRVVLSNIEDGKAARPRFMFDMGFSPILHFVVTKCRHLKIRLAALNLMEALSCPRESLWDAGTMYTICKRSIELEHDVVLTSETIKGMIDGDDETELPSDAGRIRDYLLLNNSDLLGRQICFLMWSRSGGVEAKLDSII
ncbi:hypothetical protein G7046_g5397 [Stylonectria norvegica]|nr:hypothetical protein G7046_g5397 [Stylonectria norvegica]